MVVTEWTSTVFGSRENAITSLLPLVKKLALRIAYRYRVNNFEDLVGDGNLGAIKAVDTWDPSRGASLETWAHYIIPRQMFNADRDLNPVPLSARQAIRRTNDAIDQLEIESGAALEPLEVARRFPTYAKTLAKARQFNTVSLDNTAHEMLEGRIRDAKLELADPTSDFEAAHEDESLRSEVLAAVKTLPTREQTVVNGRYFQKKTLQEIATEQHVSQQCISAIHVRAIKRLRKALEAA